MPRTHNTIVHYATAEELEQADTECQPAKANRLSKPSWFMLGVLTGFMIGICLPIVAQLMK